MTDLTVQLMLLSALAGFIVGVTLGTAFVQRKVLAILESEVRKELMRDIFTR